MLKENKKIYIQTIILFVLLVSVSLFYLSCSINDPTEDFKLMVAIPASNTTFSGMFVDAATGAPIGLDDNTILTIKIIGEGSGAVTNLAYEPTTEFTSGTGVLDFALDDAVVPTLLDPVEFAITAQADGYVSNNLPVKITEAGLYNFKLRMVKIDIENMPVGAVGAVNTGQADPVTGEVVSDIVVKTLEEPVTQANAEVTIPAGTVMEDADGNKLTGALTVTAIYQNNISEESLQSFPGGFTVQIEDNMGKTVSGITQNGAKGAFITAGFMDIDIRDVNGNKARHFKDKLLEYKMRVPRETVNPNTNEVVAVGDSVPYWNLDPETGVWMYQGQGVVAPDPEDPESIIVSGQTSGSGGQNLDWFSPEDSLSYVSVMITGGTYKDTTTMAGAYTNEFEVRIYATGSYYESGRQSENDSIYIFEDIPKDVEYIVQAYCYNVATSGGSVGQIYDIVFTEDSVEVVISVSPPIPYDPEPPVIIVLTVVGRCENNPDIEIRPSTTIYYRNLDYWDPPSWLYWYGDEYGYDYMTNGWVQIDNLQPGANYKFWAEYEGEEADTTYWIGAPLMFFDFDLEIPQAICDSLGLE